MGNDINKVLITPRSFIQSGEKALKLLRDRGYQVIINETGKTFSEEQMLEQCSDIDGLIVGIDPVTEGVIKNAKNLKAISKYGAGLDNVDVKVAEVQGIKIDRAAGTNATSVAELAVGLFFSMARSIPFTSASTKNGGWDRKKGIELTGKTVGIVGMGNIGKEVARLAHGIGMKIVAYDPYLNVNDEAIGNYSVHVIELEDLFIKADFISLHLPLTDATKHMINKDTLALMKKTTYIVNTSRGELVDEDALFDALQNGSIAGVAEDVFSKEPPGEHKLLGLDNFILTSHIGAYTEEANEKMALVSAQNLIKMMEDK